MDSLPVRKSQRIFKTAAIFQSPSFKSGPKKPRTTTRKKIPSLNRKSTRLAKQFCPFQSPALISKRKMKIVDPQPEVGKSKRFAKQFCPFQSPAFPKRKMEIRKVTSTKQAIVFDLQPEADTPKAGKVTKIISKQVVEWEPTPFDPEEYFLQDEAEAERMRDYKFSMVILFKLIFLSSFLLAF